MKNMNNKGSILAISIIFVFIFMLLGMFSMRLVILQNETSDAELYYTRTHFAALYGSELALYRIMQWENLSSTPIGASTLNPAGRKFLARDADCLNYNSGTGKWMPLDDFTGNGVGASEGLTGDPNLYNNFSDKISASDKGGILLYCEVEEEIPSETDGVIPHLITSNPDINKYGTFKYYVIRTTATMYGNANEKTEPISSASDQLHFMIAFSSGTDGAKPLVRIEATPDYPSVINGFYLTEAAELAARGTSNYPPEYIQSAPKRSILTGQVLPVFRYYIRARR